MRNRLVLSFIFLFTSIAVSAQQYGLGLHNSKPVFSHQYTFLNSDQWNFVDTALVNTRHYFNWNNAFADLYDQNILGNMGSAINPLTHTVNSNLWSYFDQMSYQPYFRSNENIRFYQTRSPLTDAQYWMGYDRGQAFRINHTQNVNEYWNLNLDYKRLNSLGNYSHDQNLQSSFLFSTNYYNPAMGYALKAYFVSDKLTAEENGGLANDSIFEANLSADRILYETLLTSDERVMRSRKVFVDQSIDFVNLFKKDENDSLESSESENKLKVGYTFDYDRKTVSYLGNSSDDFYDNYYFDKGSYYDSTRALQINNTAYIETNIGTSNVVNLKAGVNHLYYVYENDRFLISDNNLGLISTLNTKLWEDIVQLDASGDIILTGALKDAYHLAANAQLNVLKKITLFGAFDLSQKAAGFQELLIINNNFIWDNLNFSNIQTELYQVGIKWKEENFLRASTTEIQNYVYYDNQGLASQYGGAVSILKLEANENLALGRYLKWDNRITWQEVINGSDVLPLPELIIRSTVYATFPLFDRALICQIGVSGRYFSEYNSPSYMPATGQFYVANEKSIGNYPIFDFFANFQIKKARVFVKYEHFNQGFGPYAYYAAPLYPFADRTIRLGISWRFFN